MASDTSQTVLLVIDHATIYETPAGGIHIAYHVEGAAEDSHAEIPAGFARKVRAVQNANGNPLAILRGMMS